MTPEFSFDCEVCGEPHTGAPGFGFEAPDLFLEQSDKIREAGVLGPELCEYEDSEGVHYFARVVLEIPIEDCEEPFLWSVWVLLSEESFEHYVEHYDEPVPDCMYFGLLCNSLPYYENALGISADVHPRANGERPFLAVHSIKHELYKDFSRGINAAKAQKIAQICLHDG